MVPSCAYGDPRQLDLKALIEQIVAGNQTALASLYDLSSSVLYPLALRIVSNAQDAEEVIHDVYCRAWRAASTYNESRGSVMAWLVLMTRSIAIDRLRSAKRHAAASVGLPDRFDPESPTGSPEDEALSSQRSRRIRMALEALPEDQKELIELAFFSGASHSELAAQLGLPLGTVKTRIRSGLGRLRDSLEDLG